MIYLYAYTNHKENLDSLRRVKVIYDALQKEGIECEILVNEYRAQLLARDWGLPLATTIETIKDIDAVASVEDIIVIDSPEQLEGKVLEYPNNFKAVIYLNSTLEPVEFKGAEVVDVYSTDGALYPRLEENKNRENSIFIYGDSDYEKTIVKNLDYFKGTNLDLYWGIYFFVKYEDTIAQAFNNIIESEEYYEALEQYKTIYTSSLQIAIEAQANGAETYFVDLGNIDKKVLNRAKELGIEVVDVKDITNINSKDELKIIIKNNDEHIVDILKNYM